ncbi:ligand-dependent nuclear receptor-interacting factor 1 isoform X2 [Sebastes umbrosus]|uniref:ligand-dependent nuclear receptor-interacting factor 1 isoform X2 n=1 Tax=Sebastes umbrosus TaxID=72105 RepID=UPI00189EA60B|nr:ligand-dependent nuclear receptor-interacting factor 1 isoform X2 [Sebastes umbrosus]
MYPSMKEMDPVHSGTGIFYQAIPAVASDGKNIMKLIPVQMVDGQFFKSQNSQCKSDATPQKAVTTNIVSAPVQMVKMAALNPSATKQIVRQQVSLMSVSSNQVGLDLGNSLNKHPLQQQNANLMAIVPPMTTPATNSGKSGRPPSQLPVTVKSPTLSRGQCLQFPPNAQVPTVPASELLPVIKKPIFTSSANSSPNSGLPSAAYVSPIASVNIGLTPQSDSALDKLKLLCNIANITSREPPSKGSKLFPKVSQRPNSPIKWVIEEEDSSTAPTLDHIDCSVTSEVLRVVAGREIFGKHCDIITQPGPTLDPIDFSVTSEILRVAAQLENAGKPCDVITNPVFGSSQGKSGRGQEKTMAICNGKHQLHQQKAPMATPVTNSRKLGRPPNQLPVTVKSPALSRGQYLQIPPNAQVRTVQASELPPGIKKQIFTSSNNSSPSSGLPSAAYVSPIASVNLGLTPQSDSALDKLKLLCNIANKTSCGPPSKGSQPHLKLIPKVSQRPNSPIKWAIEEEDNSAAPTLDPTDFSVTSEILRVVAERENGGKHCDIITKPVSGSSQGKSGRGQENNLVMCRGKMFFVAQNPQQSLESAAPQKRQGVKMILLDGSDEVIDLCDDDTHDDTSQQAASVHMSAVTHPDEDNVIFVSYSPPKSESESESTQDLRLKTQMALVKETDQMGKSSSNNVTEQKSLDDTAGTLGRRKPGQSTSVNTVKNRTHACGSAVMHEASSISSQQSTSTKQLESMDVETKSPADPSTSDGSSEICSRMEDTHKMESSMNPAESWTSSLSPESCEMADNLLRQMFGITADVKICLQRIDGASVGSLPAEPLQCVSMRSVEDHQEPTSELKEKELFSQETDSCSGLINDERVKVPTDQELSGDSATPSPHTDIGPLECSHFKPNTKTLSVLRNKRHLGNTSLTGTSDDVETESMIGYVEPIDEDFLSTDESDTHNSQDTAARPQTPTCVDLDTSTRRMGRKRKRTTCPCCIPGTQEPEQWAWTTERTSKKGGRTNAVRKDVKTSGRISCLTAKNKHICRTSEDPASESLSTTSVDYDELKLHEQITRLKELLHEKEAALELMRNSTT